MSHSLTVRSASRPRRLRSRREEATVEVEATEEVSNEPMDLMGAVQMVLKKALAEDGLHRGLREACKVRIRRSTVPYRPVSGVAAHIPSTAESLGFIVHPTLTIPPPFPSPSIQAIESRKALLCVMAQDCDQADYTKLIQALCNEVNVHLIRVPEAVKLGEWAGLCKLDAEGTARKVVKCSCVVVSDFGDESEGLTILQEFLKSSE